MKVTTVKIDHFSAPIYCEIKEIEVHIGNVFIY